MNTQNTKQHFTAHRWGPKPVCALVGNYYIDAYVRMTVPVYLHHDSESGDQVSAVKGWHVTLNVWSTDRVTFPAYHLCARARFKTRFIVEISTTKPPGDKLSY
jgi:hypothetical protein